MCSGRPIPGVRLAHERVGERVGQALDAEAFTHRRVDRPGRDRVDADPEGCVLERCRLRQPDHAPLRRGVVGNTGPSRQADTRGRVDDHAGPLGVHVAQLGAHAEPDALEVHVEHRVVVALVRLVEPAETADDPGVVEGDIEAALERDDLVESRVHVGCDGDVELARDDAVELAATRARRSGSRSSTVTRAPSLTNPSTMARPIPEAPPVTATTLPSRPRSMLSGEGAGPARRRPRRVDGGRASSGTACGGRGRPSVRLPTISGASMLPRCVTVRAEHPDAAWPGDPDVACSSHFIPSSAPASCSSA